MTQAPDREGVSFLLSDDYGRILDRGQVASIFEIPDDDENHAVWLGCSPVGDPLSSPGSSYDLVEGDGDRPLVLLRHEGVPVGYYVDMGAWIDPAHRGRGHGARMVLAAAGRFGRAAFIDDGMRDPRDGMGFSDAGYRIHVTARELAREPPRP
jgi:GNAT superfamily N-acetyltransferase